MIAAPAPAITNDVALAFDTTLFSGDAVLESGQLAGEATLFTAVVISLFTDRIALADDALPAAETNRRGWWGDYVPPAEGDRIGSRLWLLWREKATAKTAARAREYALEALQWLIEDRIAQAVEVETELQRTPGSVVRDMLALRVTIERPDLSKVSYQFRYVWEQR